MRPVFSHLAVALASYFVIERTAKDWAPFRGDRTCVGARQAALQVQGTKLVIS